MNIPIQFAEARRCGRFAVTIALSFLTIASAVGAESSLSPTNSDPQILEKLIKRLDNQETEIKDLRAKLTAAGVTVSEPTEPVRESYPQIQFHGFGDVTYRLSDAKGDNNTFTVGQLDLFVTSRLSEKVNVLSETVLEADGENRYGVEVERLLLQLQLNDYFNVDIGRYHTSVGYYNTAYHHGAWFQTAVGRPRILDFEDGGGIIPAHNVGISMNGEIPSGRAGLRYIAEVGNGRAYQAPGTDKNLVLNVQDDNSYKAFNLVLLSRPDFAPGLQLGMGAYHDTITSVPGARVDETMLHGHAVYKNSAWEFLSEGYLIRHGVHEGDVHWTTAGFAQVARKFNLLTPYARFSYLNAPESDPVYSFIGQSGLHYGPGVGLRYDFSSLAAFKIQYDYMHEAGEQNANQLTLQAAFTF